MKKTADMIAMLMLCAAMTDCGLENERAVADLVPERASSSASLVLEESESEEAALTGEIIEHIIGNGSSSASSTLEVSKGFPLIAHTPSRCPLKFEFLGHEAIKEFNRLVDASPNKTIPVLKFKHLLAEVPPLELLKFMLVPSENGEYSAVKSSLLEKLTTPLTQQNTEPPLELLSLLKAANRKVQEKNLGYVAAFSEGNEVCMYAHWGYCSMWVVDWHFFLGYGAGIRLRLSPNTHDAAILCQARASNEAIKEFIKAHKQFALHELLELVPPNLLYSAIKNMYGIDHEDDLRSIRNTLNEQPEGVSTLELLMIAFKKREEILAQRAQAEPQTTT